jgi:hypothetical protein
MHNAKLVDREYQLMPLTDYATRYCGKVANQSSDRTHRRNTEMVHFIADEILDIAEGIVARNDMFERVDKYCARYGDTVDQIFTDRHFLTELYDSDECKRYTMLQCNLFLNHFIVFDDLVVAIDRMYGEDTWKCVVGKTCDVKTHIV